MGSQWPFDCFKLSPTTLLLSGFWQFTTVWFCGNKLTQGLWTGLQVSKWPFEIVTYSIAIKPTRSDLRVLVIYQCLILWRMNDSRALNKIDNFKFAGIQTKYFISFGFSAKIKQQGSLLVVVLCQRRPVTFKRQPVSGDPGVSGAALLKRNKQESCNLHVSCQSRSSAVVPLKQKMSSNFMVNV